MMPVEVAQQLSAAAPDGQLVLVEGDSMSPVRGDVDAICNAISRFLTGSDEGAPAGDAARLSQQELRVLRLLAGGMTNREIADLLGISVRTIERHVTNLYGKIGARGRAQAAAYALNQRLVEPQERAR